MKKNVLAAIFLLLNISSAWAQKINATDKGEVIYHVFQRSFYDSNGDLQGDLNGLREKLDYLQDLGATAILLLPLYDAYCYHNYFANDFDKIDAEFGTMQNYIALVKDIHKHGMKIYLDMETQYVTEKHLWWKDAVGNLQSCYRIYKDRKVLVVVNLSDELQVATLHQRYKKYINLLDENIIDKSSLQLNPYQVAVFEVK